MSDVTIHQLPEYGLRADEFPVDPVCGMRVDPARAIRYTVGHQILFFCQSQCLEAFRHEPVPVRGSRALETLGYR